VVVLILFILGFLCRRRRQRVSHASLSSLDYPQAREGSAPHSEMSSLLRSMQGLGRRSYPSVTVFIDVETEQHPIVDPVPILDWSSSVSSLSVTPIRPQVIPRVPVPDPFADPAVPDPFADPVADPPVPDPVADPSVPDPFADPPALVPTPEGEVPSRLSKASSYDAPDVRASVTSSNVCAFFCLLLKVTTNCFLERLGVPCELDSAARQKLSCLKWVFERLWCDARQFLRHSRTVVTEARF
jgi:hypothetical protein